MQNVIVLVVDGSTCALGAARYAIARLTLAALGTDLRIVHVGPRIPLHAASTVGRAVVENWYRIETEQAVKDVRKLLNAAKVPYRLVQRIGVPGNGIARHA